MFKFHQNLLIFFNSKFMLHLYYSFFSWHVIGDAVIKHKHPNSYALLLLRPKILWNKLGILTKIVNTMKYCFFLLFLFFIFCLSEKYLQFGKNKSICKGKYLVHFIQITRSNYCGKVIQTKHISKMHCTKKWSFLLRISSGNVTKPAGNCGFGRIYWRNP